MMVGMQQCMQFVKEYIVDVRRRWLAMIFFVAGDLVAIISGVSGKIILIPWWAWLIIGTIALAVAQFLAYKNVRKELDEARNPVRSAISGLESEVIKLGGQSIKMAELFWKMGDHFLEGILPGSTPGNIYKVVEGAAKDDCN